MRTLVDDAGIGAPGTREAPIAVALCEGHSVLRRRLLMSLEHDGDIAVIAEAELPGGLGSIIGTVSPQVMTVDMCAPYDDTPAPIRSRRATEGIERLVSAMSHVPVVALSGPTDDPALALLAGARGALPKTDAVRRGRDVVRSVAAGRLVVDRRAARSLSAMIERDHDRCGLNQHHVEVLHQVSSGRSLLELARFFRSDVPVLESKLEEIVAAVRHSRELHQS